MFYQPPMIVPQVVVPQVIVPQVMVPVLIPPPMYTVPIGPMLCPIPQPVVEQPKSFMDDGYITNKRIDEFVIVIGDYCRDCIRFYDDERQLVYRYKYLWSISLLSCNRDPKKAALVCFCYPCSWFYLTRIVKEHWSTPFVGLLTLSINLCSPVAAMRSKFRHEREIDGSTTSDTVISTLCGPCAVCQMINIHNQENHDETFDTDESRDEDGFRYCVIQ